MTQPQHQLWLERLYKDLGIKPDPVMDNRIDQLINADYELIEDLVAMRKRHNFTREDVAAKLGISPSSVARFEAHDADPSLSIIRRYAAAVGAIITHDVIDDVPAES